MHYRVEHSLFFASHVLTSLSVNLTLLLEIMHCARNLRIISAWVTPFPRINCRLLANEQTDVDYNVYNQSYNWFCK